MAEQEDKPVRRARARAKKVDSAPSLVAAIDMLRERMPGDPQFGDPLSTAGKRPVEVVAREASALQPERPSAAHSLGLAALQVWQAVSERSGRGRGDEPISVLFTDLVGFSSWALEAGDAAAVRLLREAGIVLEGSVEERDGVIVKRLGDGLMAVFEHPQPAVEAALEAHDGLAQVHVDGYQPQMRAGVHHGRPRLDLTGVRGRRQGKRDQRRHDPHSPHGELERLASVELAVYRASSRETLTAVP